MPNASSMCNKVTSTGSNDLFSTINPTRLPSLTASPAAPGGPHQVTDPTGSNFHIPDRRTLEIQQEPPYDPRFRRPVHHEDLDPSEPKVFDIVDQTSYRRVQPSSNEHSRNVPRPIRDSAVQQASFIGDWVKPRRQPAIRTRVAYSNLDARPNVVD